jgi:hypothetical protein
MKRAERVRHLAGHGCELVPRHTEILTPVANRVCKDLGIPRPGDEVAAPRLVSDLLPLPKADG